MQLLQYLPKFLAAICLATCLSASPARGIKLHPRQEIVAVNITIDNDMMSDETADARQSLAGFVSLNLTGVWTTSTSLYQEYGFRGSYLWTRDPDARAELKFIGTDVYYMSPMFSTLPSFTFMTEIQLDNQPRALVNLGSQSNISVSAIRAANTSAILWSRQFLNHSEHTITLSMAQGAQYAILDALTYTVLLDSTDPQIPTTSNPFASSATSSSHLSKPARIAIITLCSVLLAVVVYIAFRYVQLKSKQRDIRNGRGVEGVRRWVDMRWVNASRTNLGASAGVGGGVGVAGATGDVKDPEGMGMKMEMSKMEQV